MFVATKNVSNFPFRPNADGWEKFKAKADMQGMPLNTLLDRLVEWFVDQDDAKQSEVIRHAAAKNYQPARLKIAAKAHPRKG